ncbi:uncharacterized protein si:ch211-266o15.1 isoform X3 [Pangasianodon hypophthalmus]|uniref:uncharacterized protein si:ch211-266o15.1 isoform X3 n=1 Tax=Pangasianodon hypophthalmus TaxID=310915 RepID=UPI002307AD71|nr:uncharacterized protein si:ch211-266o15.1 isoform X3 [Pangasianodon hypophthalmus]XP_053093360.1 uncharacterized protein si:ch211-266o15.1 isoform X3 [Pangasianodon hypophthalmus]
MAENNAENVSSVEEESQKETEPSLGAEIPRSDSSKQGMEEDELDGLPVFGADEEEGDLESSSTQKDNQTDDRDENENRSSVSPRDNEAGESVQCSQMEDTTSQNEGSASSQEPAEGSREEIMYSPLKKIKDEPIDEDYDKALISSAQSDVGRVKEELENGDHESLVPLDELRISSVFSVRGNSDAISAPVAAPQPSSFTALTQTASAIRPPPIVLQAQMQPHFQAHLQLQPKTLAQLQPHLQTHLQAQLQTHLQPQLQLQAQLQAQLQTQLQPQLPHQLQPQLPHQLQPQLPHQLQPQLSHQLPHQLQPQLPHQLQPQLPHQLQPQLPHQLQPQTPPQLQTQPPPHPQAQPTHQLQQQPPQQQQPPPAPVRICCSGCSKVLQKGQTAFQKKGSNQLFCSTVCLTGFTLPPAPNIAPKKTCHLCLKVIGNPKDLITVPVDSANTLKEFCSLSCLSIYKSRVEGLAEEDAVVRCAVCRNPSEIQHEVNHQGILHRLCSDECFSRFRSSKRLSMSCCESCGNCTVTGNYHLVQIEDTVKKFCSPACISTFKQKSGKRVHCPCCQDFKAMDQMLEGTNAQGVIEFFCSSRCVANSQASCTLSGASFPCTNCQKLAVPQYHLAMPDGSIRNFCSYECVGRFQERLHRSIQMNGGSYHSPNTGVHPPLPHSSAQGYNPPPNTVPALNQNTISPYVPASRLTNLQDTQQQPEALGPVKLTCKQCQKQFSSKPEVLQFKNHVGLFCSRLCCDMYKRERDVKAVCEYCKEEKVAKDIVVYEKQPRAFCCEGCKLLYKHDYAKQHGGQCRVCAYCCNVTHKTIQNHFGGKLEEFCSEECMSLYTVLFYEMAKCHACKNQGPLKESVRWDEMVRHFCNLHCLLHFCSKSIIPDQPNSNGINTAATTAQAPLSLSKDMPVIGGVVSLASALAGNTALTGALPTSNASSKIIGDASTQTDASVNGDPQQRRMLKNKAVMCKPINDEQSIQCEIEPPKLLSETVIDEKGEKVRLVPVPIPVPTPIYIPVPMHLYTQYTPLPLGFPLPIPVPMVVPASQESAQSSSTKGGVPSQSSVEDEDVEKGKSRPLSHGDQGSTYSGDLESEARSTPFSWADPEDSSHNLKPSVPSSELEGPKDPPATSTASKLLDLEKDIPLASNDHEATKEQKSSAKRRKRGKKGSNVEEPKSFKEELDVADCAQSILDTNLDQFNMESCQHSGTLGRSIFISSECVPLDDVLQEAQNTFKYGEEFTSSSGSMIPSRPSLKTGSKTVRVQTSCTKKQFCVYCQKSNTKIARHLEQMHSNETDVAYALSFPKRSKRRHMLLEQLRKKGNYQHNIEVIRNGNGDIVMQKQTKRKRSAMEYLPCQYCLAFFLREGLEKHEYLCRTKMISQSCPESLEQLETKHESCFQPTPELNAQSLVKLNLVHLQSPKSSSEARSHPDLVSSLPSSAIGCSELICQHNLERCSFSSTQSSPESSPESSDQIGLKSFRGPSHIFSQPSPEPFLPTNSDLGQSPRPDFSDECTFTSSPEPSPQPSFESHLQPNELSSPATIHPSPKPCYESSLMTSAESNPETAKASFELCLPSTPEPGPLPYLESSPSHLSVDSCCEEVLRSSPETSLPRTPEYCSIVESNVKTTLESCLVSSMAYTDASSSATLNVGSCHQPIVSQMSSPHPTQPSFESFFLSSVACDLRPPPSPELCSQTASMLSHESTLQSDFESCTQAEKSSPTSSCCSFNSYHQTSLISGEHSPDPSQTSFELCLSSSPETSPVPDHESDPGPQISCESCFEPVFQSSSATSHFPTSESFRYHSVESNMKPNVEPCLTSSMKCSSPPPSSAEANTESISQIPSASSHCLDSDASSGIDYNLINGDSSVEPPAESLTYQKNSVDLVDVDSTFSSPSCAKTSSQCETLSTLKLKKSTGSLSSLKSSSQSSSNSSLICSPSSEPVLSQQISLNKTPDGERLGKKRQFCLYCKKPYIKMARHLSQKHVNEKDVARALSFRKGSKKRLVLFEQLRKKGNYQHNVEVLKNGSGELITCKRATKDHSVGVYLPCQYCLAFYIRHDLWRHERRCKMRTNGNPVCLKRTASSKLLPLQGSVSGDLEEAIHSMKQDNVLHHIRDDALICKYGARLFEKLGHDKKRQVYVTQKMRELARFMLAVKELDGSVQYLHHVCTPSRLDLVIKGAKIVSGFDETLSKFEKPSLALKIGNSIRQAAEIICGENVMEGDTETVANVKEFIRLLEKNWISCAKSADQVNPDSTEVESCLDRPIAELSCQEDCPVSNKPSQNLKPELCAHRRSQDDSENVDSNECGLCTVISNGSQFYPDKNKKLHCSTNAVEPSTNTAVQPSVSQQFKISYLTSEVLPLRTRTAKNGKKHFCIYCRKPFIKLARHLSRNHAKEKDVAHALSFPKGSKTRHCLLKQLRNRGNYQHNIEVQQTGNGEIIPLRRQKKYSSLNSYQACPHCLGFFLQRDLWKHQRSCKMKKDDENPPCRRRSRSALSKNLALHDSLSEGCQNLVRNMRDDDVSKYLRNDALICKFGNKLYEKHGHEKEGHEYISQKMRALGRFMLAVRELDHNVEDLYQVCTESRFSLALEAAKKVGGFDPHSNKFKKSVALKMSCSLKWATEVALGEEDMGDEARTQAKKFIQLLGTNWFSYEPSHIHTTSTCMQTEGDIIHLIEDVVKLKNFLKNTGDKAKLELVEHPHRKSWKRLRQSLLAEIALFNRGRRSIAEKMLLEDYIQRDKEPIHGKMCEPLTKLEQALDGVLISVGVTCKDGSRTPVLFTERMASSLDILIKYRDDVGVPMDNPYMFPQMMADAHIRAHDCIRAFAQNCGANKPEVHTHKYVATIFQILSLNGSEKQQIAALVGDDSFDYQTLDENVSQLAKICSLLQTMEEGTGAYKDTGLGHAAALRCKRQKWKKEEQRAVRRQLGNYISINKVPGKKDCLDCIRAEPEALRSRTWRGIKNYVHNTIRSKKRKGRGSRQMDESEEASESADDDLGEVVAMEAAAKRPRRKRRRRHRV